MTEKQVDEPGAAIALPWRARFRRDFAAGVRSGLWTFWTLARVMIPAYAAALILQKLGVIGVLAHIAQPVMKLVGLPGGAAVPLVVGYILNTYAAIGAMLVLHLTGQQITLLALAILIGHNLLVEGAVLQKAGVNGIAFGIMRALAGLFAAGVAHQLMVLLR